MLLEAIVSYLTECPAIEGDTSYDFHNILAIQGIRKVIGAIVKVDNLLDLLQ